MKQFETQSPERVVRMLPPQRDKSYAYRMGYDSGKNGPNTENCSFAIFSPKENTREWERGYRDGKKRLKHDK